MSSKGIDMHVACLHPALNRSRIQDSGVTLHELHGRSNYDPSLLWQLIRIIRKVKPDLIQTWLLQMDVLAGLAAVLTSTPFIMTERSAAPLYNGSWKITLRSWIGPRAALIVADSNSGREYWLSKKHPDRIKVIRSGIPAEEI